MEQSLKGKIFKTLTSNLLEEAEEEDAQLLVSLGVLGVNTELEAEEIVLEAIAIQGREGRELLHFRFKFHERCVALVSFVCRVFLYAENDAFPDIKVLGKNWRCRFG
jgi:hypothetical protein